MKYNFGGVKHKIAYLTLRPITVCLVLLAYVISFNAVKDSFSLRPGLCTKVSMSSLRNSLIVKQVRRAYCKADFR